MDEEFRLLNEQVRKLEEERKKVEEEKEKLKQEQNEKVNLEEVLKRLSLLEKQNAVFVEKEKIQKEQEYEKIRIEEQEKLKKIEEEKQRKINEEIQRIRNYTYNINAFYNEYTRIEKIMYEKYQKDNLIIKDKNYKYENIINLDENNDIYLESELSNLHQEILLKLENSFYTEYRHSFEIFNGNPSIIYPDSGYPQQSHVPGNDHNRRSWIKYIPQYTKNDILNLLQKYKIIDVQYGYNKSSFFSFYIVFINIYGEVYKSNTIVRSIAYGNGTYIENWTDHLYNMPFQNNKNDILSDKPLSKKLLSFLISNNLLISLFNNNLNTIHDLYKYILDVELKEKQKIEEEERKKQEEERRR
jgi:hypothetical protein